MNTKLITVTDYKTFRIVYELDETIVGIHGTFIGHDIDSFSIEAMRIEDYLNYMTGRAQEKRGQISVYGIIHQSPNDKNGIEKTASFDHHGRLEGGWSFANVRSSWIQNFPGGYRWIPVSIDGYTFGIKSIHVKEDDGKGMWAHNDGELQNIIMLGWFDEAWQTGFAPVPTKETKDANSNK